MQYPANTVHSYPPVTRIVQSGHPARYHYIGKPCNSFVLMIQNQVVCFDEIKEKDLFAAKNGIKMWNHPPIDKNGQSVPTAKVLSTVNKGQRVGMLYSFLERPDGLWLMVYPFIGANAWFVKAENNAFSLSALQQQGTTTEQQYQQQNQTWWETITNTVTNTISDTVKPTQTIIKWGVPLLIGYVFYDQFISSRSRLLRKL
jgi:hypothetical protein